MMLSVQAEERLRRATLPGSKAAVAINCVRVTSDSLERSNGGNDGAQLPPPPPRPPRKSSRIISLSKSVSRTSKKSCEVQKPPILKSPQGTTANGSPLLPPRPMTKGKENRSAQSKPCNPAPGVPKRNCTTEPKSNQQQRLKELGTGHCRSAPLPPSHGLPAMPGRRHHRQPPPPPGKTKVQEPLRQATASPLPASDLETSSINLGAVLSHAIRVALVSDALQPRRAPSRGDYGRKIEHRPYLENNQGDALSFNMADWFPVVFRALRSAGGIAESEFLTSVGEQALKGGAQGEGKSGAIFFHSSDGKFVVKEVRKSERDTLGRILQSMVAYLDEYPYSFLPRFYGLYTIGSVDGVLADEMTFVVMQNILDQGREDLSRPLRIYDLKGSVENRFIASPQQYQRKQTARTKSPLCDTASPARIASDSRLMGSGETRTPIKDRMPLRRASSSPATRASKDGRASSPFTPRRGKSSQIVLKDLNLQAKCILGLERKTLLMRQLQKDVEFLEKHNLMDYSFLLAIASDDNAEAVSVRGCDAGVSNKAARDDNLRLKSESSARTQASEVDFCNLSFDVGDDCEDEGTDSEIGAILRRNSAQRRVTHALIPDNSVVDSVRLIGHGVSKRSRESSTFFRDKCTLYTFLVSCTQPKCTDDRVRKSEWVIFRRYKDFEKLQRGLEAELNSASSSLRLPSLPPKQRLGFMSDQFVQQREKELECWLQSIMEIVGGRVESPVLHDFLTLKANRCPHKWKAQSRDLRDIVQRRSSSIKLAAAVETGDQDQESANLNSSFCSISLEEESRIDGPFQSSLSGLTSQETMALFDDCPNSERSLQLWPTLGGCAHKDFPAIKVKANVGAAFPGALTQEAYSVESAGQPVRLFVGVIDILQTYNLRKQLESVFKGLTNNADGISAVDPERYGERFLAFMDEFVFE